MTLGATCLSASIKAFDLDGMSERRLCQTERTPTPGCASPFCLREECDCSSQGLDRSSKLIPFS